jgi:hypothetical protein
VRLGEAAQAPGALRRQFCQILNDTEPTAQSLIFQDGVVPASSWGQEWLHVALDPGVAPLAEPLLFPSVAQRGTVACPSSHSTCMTDSSDKNLGHLQLLSLHPGFLSLLLLTHPTPPHPGTPENRASWPGTALFQL